MPGAEIYEGRLAKATAVPPEQRSADEAAFVAGCALLEEAAAVLVPMIDGREQPSEQARTAALLKWASVMLTLEPSQPMGLPHVQLSTDRYCHPALRPLMVPALVDGEACFLGPELADMLDSGQPVRSLERLVQLMVLARITMDHASIPGAARPVRCDAPQPGGCSGGGGSGGAAGGAAAACGR